MGTIEVLIPTIASFPASSTRAISTAGTAVSVALADALPSVAVVVTSPELSDAVTSVDVDVSASAEEVDSEAATEAVVTSNPASSAADAANDAYSCDVQTAEGCLPACRGSTEWLGKAYHYTASGLSPATWSRCARNKTGRIS